MTVDFLAQLIGNPTQAKILRAFVSNAIIPMPALLVAERAGVNSKLVAPEIQKLVDMGVVKRAKSLQEKHEREGQKNGTVEQWILNDQFKHVRALSSFVQEVSPAEFSQVEQMLKSAGKLTAVILSGVFMGDPTRPADLVIAADSLNERRLERAVRDLEPLFGREIRYAAFSTPEFRYRLTVQDRLIRDTLEYPHRVLVNRSGVIKMA